MQTVEDLGRKAKAKYPDYRDMSDLEVGKRIKLKYPEAYSDFIEVEAMRAQSRAEYEIDRNTSPVNSTILFYALGTVLLLISMWLFYNVNDYSGWNIFAVLVISIVLFILGINVFIAGHKNRQKEYEFAKQKIDDRLAFAAKQEELRKTIANRSVEEEERQTKIALHQYERGLMMTRLRNEMLITEAANRELLDTETYIAIRMMHAQAEIDLRKTAAELKIDLEYKKELQNLQLIANRTEAELDIAMADIKLLLPFHEVSTLNTQLAELSLQLEEAEKLTDSEYKKREIKRITEQMQTWRKKIRERQKRLL
ncbi:MAG: hypothetical protein LUM44_11215 [Pyrinomonadaceae bacterium]|nr:hypothetical protein [Pyrinomonadaceae bacterium]